MTAASGRIPQLSLVLGAAAGGAAYGPALTDVVVMAPDARVFVTGPDVVRRVTGENLDAAGLGGPDVHDKSGVAHLTPVSEAASLQAIRDLAGLLGRHGQSGDALPQGDPGVLLPESKRRAYDVRPLVRLLLDTDAPQVELQPKWAPNIVTVLGRLGGRSVGVVASQPMRLGGCLNSAAADKAARFVRLCDALGLPVITVVDVPGYLPGGRQEAEGVVRRGAKLLHAYAGATVPLLTLVTRKAFGGAYIAMASRSLGASCVLAWPGAEIGVMGAEAAVDVLHRRELDAAEDRPTLHAELARSYHERAVGIDSAVANGLVDEVVAPAHTRSALAAALATRDTGARGRWGNIPL
jgi:acetyl-CoA/propionyl-CoA carboxylase carboxyl transferase subunit